MQEQEPHPENEMLIAYLSNALTGVDASKVGRHARLCDRCIARLLSLRKSLASDPDARPSADLVERAKGQFRAPQRRRSLGELLIQPVKGLALGLTYHPGDPDVWMGLSSLAKDSLDRMHPAPASADLAPLPPRLADASQSFKRSAISRKWRPFRARRQKAERSPELENGMDFLLESGASGEMSTGEVQLEAGTIRLSFSGKLADNTARLEISALDSLSNSPAQELELTLVPEKGDPLTLETDPTGAAHVDVPAGISRLLIHTKPTLELFVNFRS